METMTLTIHIPKNVYLILEKKAEIRGLSIEEYVVYLIEKDIAEQSAKKL